MSTNTMTTERPKPSMQELLRTSRIIKKVKQRVPHDGRESIESKTRRWQQLRTPEMPLEALPVGAYDPGWVTLFELEKARIEEVFRPQDLGIVEHIGSTSIPGLGAKPIVDLLVSVTAPALERRKVDAFAAAGYTLYGNAPCDPEASWLWKFESDSAFSIHLCELENPWIETALNFRDYMRAHPQDCAAFEEGKRQLSAEGSLSHFEYSMEKLVLWYGISVKANAWAQAVRGESQPQARARDFSPDQGAEP